MSGSIDALPRDVLDRLLEGCQVVDHDFRYIYVNDACVAQARKTREELLGRTMAECYPGIEATEMFGKLRGCMASRAPVRMENEFTYPDGRRAFYQLEMIPVPQGVCVLSLDVTEGRNRLAAIVDGSNDAIVGRNLDGVITSWNRGAERIFGYTAAQMIGQNTRMEAPASIREEEERVYRRILAGEVIAPYETRRVRKDGTLVDLSVSASPIHDASGALVGISGIARDVTEMKRVQRDLEASNKELEAFGYSVAHDLRAPLRGIDGFAEALAEDCSDQLGEQGREFLGHIRDAAKRMSQLIEDMLRLSKIARSELTRRPIDVTAIAESALRRIAQRDPERRVDVSIARGLFAEGDAQLVEIVFENLLGNAWKFTSKTAAPKIAVGSVAVDGRRAFYVRDNGAGFDMKYAHKLFGVFQRLHGQRDFEGTGVGLATVQRIVQRHGGRIWAEAAVDAGATFYFTLP